MEVFCFVEYGDIGIVYIVVLVFFDCFMGKCCYFYVIKGIWVNWVKVVFEKYFFVKMCLGVGLFWFEKLGLRLFFGLLMFCLVMVEDIV